MQFARAEIAASGTIEGRPLNDDHPVRRDGLRTLLAGQEAEGENEAGGFVERSR